MQLRKLVLVLGLAMVLGGCGEKDNTEEQQGMQQKEQQKEQQEISQNTYEGIYDDFLEKIYNFIVNSPDDLVDMGGMGGIYEAAIGKSSRETLSAVGYHIQDLNGDEIPELMLGEISENRDGKSYGKMVYSLYTYVDGEPKLVFEGFYRNRYEWMGDGKFYYTGSGSAIYSMFGTYELSSDGTELISNGYYFSHEKDEDFTEIGYYYNTSGKWDIDVSEEITNPETNFWPVMRELERETKEVEWITFENLK